ncbi:MAG: hypothetical protein ACREQE_05095 [Candidatus Binataceae bacterium]
MFLATGLAGSQSVHKTQLLELSQAILRGCKLKPRQCFGTYSHGNYACVIGAAEAGGFIGSEAYSFLGSYYSAGCPACADLLGRSFGELLIHLNDSHEWSRERIAHFVESLG